MVQRESLKLMRKKALTIFNDGTFAWGFEGGFYREVFPTDNPISLILRSLYTMESMKLKMVITIILQKQFNRLYGYLVIINGNQGNTTKEM